MVVMGDELLHREHWFPFFVSCVVAWHWSFIGFAVGSRRSAYGGVVSVGGGGGVGVGAVRGAYGVRYGF